MLSLWNRPMIEKGQSKSNYPSAVCTGSRDRKGTWLIETGSLMSDAGSFYRSWQRPSLPLSLTPLFKESGTPQR